MQPTIYLAILSHPRRNGTAIGMAPTPGAPLHLSLHTDDQEAVDALNAATLEEWNREYGWRLGYEWDRAARSRRMVEDGYVVAMIERPVQLTAEVPQP
jgi:hypothetical protein